MREWGFIAPSRVGRTQRLKVLSVAGGFSGRRLPLSLRTKPGCTAKECLSRDRYWLAL
jgi:hypothetical protein